MTLAKSLNFSEPVSSCIKWEKYNIGSMTLGSYDALLRYIWKCFVICKVPIRLKFLVLLLFTGTETLSVYISRIFLNTHKMVKMMVFMYVCIDIYLAFHEKTGQCLKLYKTQLTQGQRQIYFWSFKQIIRKGRPG